MKLATDKINSVTLFKIYLKYKSTILWRIDPLLSGDCVNSSRC
jgi:hypothetical protein